MKAQILNQTKYSISDKNTITDSQGRVKFKMPSTSKFNSVKLESLCVYNTFLNIKGNYTRFSVKVGEVSYQSSIAAGFYSLA